MCEKRDAVDTITGYFYQFDYYINKILEQRSDIDYVYIEGIEDIDLVDADETTAIQCKYYAKTIYNHSVIAKPIRLMLNHFSKNTSREAFNYKLYGYYSSGHEKLPEEISVTFLKDKFLTFSHDKVEHKYYDELGLTDEELADFLDHLHIDIYAKCFEDQQKQVISNLMRIFSCSEFEAEVYYYNNALKLVKELSTKQIAEERKMAKRDFVKIIDNKSRLFELWFLRYKGIENYCKLVRKEYFTKCNISPYERFFLIHCDENITDIEIKALIQEIATKWSCLSKRTEKPFSPYIYLHNIDELRLINIKKLLCKDTLYFLDGYDFKGADFSVSSITRKPNYYNDFRFKIIEKEEELNAIIVSLNYTCEIYQFFIDTPYYKNEDCFHTIIPINETNYVKHII